MRTFLLAAALFFLPANAFGQNLDSPMSVDYVSELRYNCVVHERVLAGRILESDDGLRTATCPSFIVGVVTGVQLQAITTQTAPLFCAPSNLTIGQEIQVFLNWANAHPEAWNDRAAIGVGRAMMQSFPCR